MVFEISEISILFVLSNSQAIHFHLYNNLNFSNKEYVSRNIKHHLSELNGCAMLVNIYQCVVLKYTI